MKRLRTDVAKATFNIDNKNLKWRIIVITIDKRNKNEFQSGCLPIVVAANFVQTSMALEESETKGSVQLLALFYAVSALKGASGLLVFFKRT